MAAAADQDAVRKKIEPAMEERSKELHMGDQSTEPQQSRAGIRNITSLLADLGFKVTLTPHAYGVETAFMAEYGSGGRVVAFNAEINTYADLRPNPTICTLYASAMSSLGSTRQMRRAIQWSAWVNGSRERFIRVSGNPSIWSDSSRARMQESHAWFHCRGWYKGGPRFMSGRREGYGSGGMERVG
ncbi:hypothetical protein P175DRAFT_0497113 [Aspergillus ochraceoroseus IBT 24754]|uniref:Uncharacterized protein n=1 Tax=Aspergillus ochraceoroseus IBT 24754 TaxID=1392256 RepID=A0A2T5M659_9EURO|nr:uncharacterized protein P175DRAFT_0497113 [Aspergillus ochraceoroseus IBT 24754]PTU23986.1 hypothetical protein P175DRAFT_0497113 [Aspergillus ochraceoroseus IBT 24754]